MVVDPKLPVARSFVVQYSKDSNPARRKVIGRIEHVLSGQCAHLNSQAEFDEFVTRVLCEQTRRSQE